MPRAAKTKFSVSFPGPMWASVCAHALGARVSQEEAILAFVARGLAGLEMLPPPAAPVTREDEEGGLGDWTDDLVRRVGQGLRAREE